MLAAPDTFAATVTVSGIVMTGMSDISHRTIRILRFAYKPTRNIADDPLLRPDCLCDSAQTIPRRFSNICLWVFDWLTGELKRSLFSTECGPGG